MTESREQLVGQLQRPGQKPENVRIISQKVPILTEAEIAAGIEGVDGRYEPGDYRRHTSDTPDANGHVTFQVGSTGYFATINEAISIIFTKPDPNVSIVLNLVTGFVMAEEVHIINGVDLGWIKIQSTDATVTIQRSSITTDLSDYELYVDVPISSNRFAAFFALNNSILPTIETLFDMDTSGTATNRFGISCQYNSKVTVGDGAGVTNASRGIELQINSDGTGFNAIFDDSYDVGVRPANNSRFHGQGVSVARSAIGISVGQGAIAHVQNAVATTCTSVAISVSGAYVFARNANLSSSGQGIQMDGACSVEIDEATINDVTNRGIYCRPDSSCIVRANDVTINDAGTNAVENYSSRINLSDATIADAGGRGIACFEGGFVAADGASVTGSLGAGDLTVTSGSQITILGGETGTAASGTVSAADTNVTALNIHDANDGIIYSSSSNSVTVIATDTATNIASATASINTTDKYTGKRVWDTTNNRELRSSGSGTTSTWYVVDGSTSVTPV